MTRVKKFRIDGEIFWAETPDSAYEQYAKGWRNVGALEGGFKPLVPVFTEHPPVERSSLQLGQEIHTEEFKKCQRKWSLQMPDPDLKYDGDVAPFGMKNGDTLKHVMSDGVKKAILSQDPVRVSAVKDGVIHYETIGKHTSSKPNEQNLRRGIVQTGRTDSSKPNISNARREETEALQDHPPEPELPKNSREFHDDFDNLVLEFEYDADDVDDGKHYVRIASTENFEHRVWYGEGDVVGPWKQYLRASLRGSEFPEDVITWLEAQWGKLNELPKNSREFRDDFDNLVLEFEDEDGDKNQVRIEDENSYRWRYELKETGYGHWGFRTRVSLIAMTFPKEVNVWLEREWDTNGSAPNVQNVRDAFERIKFLEGELEGEKNSNMRIRKAVGDHFVRSFQLGETACIIDIPEMMADEILRLEAKGKALEQDNFRQQELLDATEENNLVGGTLGSSSIEENDSILTALENSEKLLKLKTEELEVLQVKFDAQMHELGKIIIAYSFICEAITGDQHRCEMSMEGVKSLIADMMHGHPCADRCYMDDEVSPDIDTSGECTSCGETWPHRPEGLFRKLEEEANDQ